MAWRFADRPIACLGLALLLLTRVLDWQDVLDEKGAWDALIWFGGLVMLAGQLDKAGLAQGIRRRGGRSRRRLAVVVGARRAARRLSLLALRVRQPRRARHRDVPGVLRGRGRPRRAAAAGRRSRFGFFSSLNAAITHYGTGPAPIVFGGGLSDAGAMVARRLPDLAGAPGDLAADRLSLVEDDRPVVTQ